MDDLDSKALEALEREVHAPDPLPADHAPLSQRTPPMTEPTNEQIERAAALAGSDGAIPDLIRELAKLPTSHASRSILAHARTIAEAEAREARLREALEGSLVALDEAANVLSDGYSGMAKIVRGYADKARTTLQENPDG